MRMFNRSVATFNGITAKVDPYALELLEEMNTVFERKVFYPPGSAKSNSGFIAAPLEPKDKGAWDPKSMLDLINVAKENSADVTLDDLINQENELSNLRYKFQESLTDNSNTLGFDDNTILAYDGITNFLVYWAYSEKKAKDINAIKNYVFQNKDGLQSIKKYVLLSATNYIIEKEQLNIPDIKNVQNSVLNSNITFSQNSLQPKIHYIIDDNIKNSEELLLITDTEKTIGDIDNDLYPLLIEYIKKSPVKIEKKNAKYFIPLFLSQILDNQQNLPTLSNNNTIVSSDDDAFKVEFLTDDKNTMNISATNLNCAAQLAYSRIMDVDLDVFNVMNYFTHKYLINQSIEIKDPILRDHLQYYVLSNKFSHTGKQYDRTKPSEREMFYKQVFNAGNAQLTEDFIVNTEFKHLWKTLVVECAKYINRVQDSPNPENFVSRQPIMQALEDLQYNISSHCTGMATVVTPVIYKEIDFITRKILSHEEIVRQVVPSGGSWYRVLEVLYSAMKLRRPKTSVIYNKAKLNFNIIKTLADYNPATFEDDAVFNNFMSMMDAMIICESNLLEKREDDDDSEEETTPKTPASLPNMNGFESKNIPQTAASGEWDF